MAGVHLLSEFMSMSYGLPEHLLHARFSELFLLRSQGGSTLSCRYRSRHCSFYTVCLM